MASCPECGENIEKDSFFCQSCGIQIDKKRILREGFLSKFDRSLYFRIARGFTWFILFVAILTLAGLSIYLAPPLLALFREETNVTHDEVRIAIESEKKGIPLSEERIPEKTDPKLSAALAEEIRKLINILPKDMQAIRIETLSFIIENKVTYWMDVRDKISVVKEARSILSRFSENERWKALDKFLVIKIEKENSARENKKKARERVSSISLAVLSMVVLITQISMILMLLSAERTTGHRGRS
jgi:hypothetical protein